MAYFITRVELHGVRFDNEYERLHAEMAREGFMRTIIAKGGAVLSLPTATYCKITDDELAVVLESAKRAATRIKSDFEVLITQAAEISNLPKITWYNLSPVR